MKLFDILQDRRVVNHDHSGSTLRLEFEANLEDETFVLEVRATYDGIEKRPNLDIELLRKRVIYSKIAGDDE